MARKGRGRVHIYYNPLPGNLTEYGAKLFAGLQATMQWGADRCESYGRAHAPWTDQTGNARNGLKAVTYSNSRSAGTRGANGRFLKAGVVFGIIFFHSVPYGIYLETRFNGKYRIIVPTIQKVGPEVIEAADGIAGALR